MNAWIGCLIPIRVRTCGCSLAGWFRGGEFLCNTMVEQGAGYHLLHARSLCTGSRVCVSFYVSLRDLSQTPVKTSVMSYYMVTFLKHTETSEMAVFHVWYFDAFWRQTLKVAGSVHRSMSYGCRKFQCRSAKDTSPTCVWKRHLRKRNCSMRPRGEVPPDFTPRFGDFVLQLAFRLKWPYSKFGMKPLNPGGGFRGKRGFFPVLVFFGVGVVSRLYLCCVWVHTDQSWQTGSLVNGLQLCEAWRS